MHDHEALEQRQLLDVGLARPAHLDAFERLRHLFQKHACTRVHGQAIENARQLGPPILIAARMLSVKH